LFFERTDELGLFHPHLDHLYYVHPSIRFSFVAFWWGPQTASLARDERPRLTEKRPRLAELVACPLARE
jgi:hypothetical protein